MTDTTDMTDTERTTEAAGALEADEASEADEAVGALEAEAAGAAVTEAAGAEAAPQAAETSAAAGKAPQILFVALVSVLMLIPSVGMLWARTDTTTENRELAPLPTLWTESGFTEGYLGELGAYFDDHFAYRDNLISANSWLRERIFGVSSTEQVVVGTDGWLYYNGTLADYLGATPLSDAALDNAAHNLFLMQTYVESTGARFVFTIAPNKNTLYPRHMPPWFMQSSTPSNAERLKPHLERYGVHYVDLFEVFAAIPDELYHTRDTHWTGEGALVAHNALMAALGREGLAADGATIEREDFIGDLETMLYPSGGTREPNRYYPGISDGPGQTGSLWRYEGTARDVEQDWVETAGAGEGTALVFRDSFGNALLPYLAAQTQSAGFSKLVPYNATLAGERSFDYVIVERAERHLAYLSEVAPAAPSPMLNLDASALPQREVTVDGATLETGENGPFAVFSGTLDPTFRDLEGTVLLSLRTPDGEELFYEPYTLSLSRGDESEDGSGGGSGSGNESGSGSGSESGGEDEGFLAAIPQASLQRGQYVVSVLLHTNDRLIVLQSLDYLTD